MKKKQVQTRFPLEDFAKQNQPDVSTRRKGYRLVILWSCLLIVLIGLGFAWYFIENYNPKEEEKPITDTQNYMVVSLNKDDIISVHRKTPEFENTFVKQEDNWIIQGSPDIELMQSSISSYMYDVSYITTTELIEERVADFDVYGLGNEPRKGALTITVAGGDATVLKVGDKTPPRTHYYVQNMRSDTVYAVSVYTMDSILARVDNYRDKKIGDITGEDVNYVNVAASGGKTLQLVKKTGDALEKAQNEYLPIWEMVQPYAIDANVDILQTEILSQMDGLTIRDFIDDKPGDLSKYGLVNPTTVSWANEESKATLLLGKKEDNYMYAKFPDKPYVFTVDADRFAFIDIDPVRLMYKLLYLKNIDIVSNVELNYGGDKYSIDINAADEKVSVNGNERDYESFKKVYQEIIGLALANVHTGGFVAAAPDLSIVYTFNNGEPQGYVNLIPVSDRFYVAEVNGDMRFTVEKKTVENMIEKVRGFYNQKV